MVNKSNIIISLLMLIIITLFINIFYTGTEGFLPDFSDYTTIDRIRTIDNSYAYCIGGNISCNSGTTQPITNTGYTGGLTYSYLCAGTNEYVVCKNFVDLNYGTLEKDSVGQYKWYTPNKSYFPFSDIYRGFTVPTPSNNVDISINNLEFYNSSHVLVDTMNKCDFLNSTEDTYKCKSTWNKPLTYDTTPFGLPDITTDVDMTNLDRTTNAPVIYNNDFMSTNKGLSCMSDYGTMIGDNLCNGEFGLVKDTNMVCPYNKPICNGYRCGSELGKCEYQS